MRLSLLKPVDYAIVIVVSTAIALISFQVYRVGGEPVSVSVKTETDLSMYPLDENRHLEIKGPLGITVIEIEGQKVQVLSSPCRDKLCILKGTLHRNGDWTACMPNRVYVGIEGKAGEELDEVSY